jgi:hypothetical protein
MPVSRTVRSTGWRLSIRSGEWSSSFPTRA